MEHRMLCGLGACLGCTIETTEGMKRVCKDGPVFDSKILKFNKPAPRRKPLSADEEVDLSFDMAGIHFENPTIATAGTFAYGQNFRGVSDVRAWGGITSKGWKDFMRTHGYHNLAEMRGIAQIKSAD